ncbi:MAG: DUF790 family protein, partial [Thermoplasmata archaeon]
MFPSALLLARARKDGVHPVFLGEPMLPQAEAVLRLYRQGVNQSRRELERRTRDLEAKVDKYKVIRGLALLVERRCTFLPREGPPPGELRRRLFDTASGAAVTPEERAAVLLRLAPEFGLDPMSLADHLWADLEEEEALRVVPPMDPADLLRRFNLGQCQTLLFKATQMALTFGTAEAYRAAVSRVKRQGLMFTAEAPADGSAPILRVEGVVSFLRSTERYGTRLAQLLPNLLSLPGWTLTAKVLYRDSMGRKRHLDFRLDHGMAEYLDVKEEAPPAAPLSPAMEALAASAEQAGFQVERDPAPLAVGQGFEYPDLTLTREETPVYMESIGYWAPEWVRRKLLRTERTPGPYFVVAPKDGAVAAATEHPRLLVAGKQGVDLRVLQGALSRWEERIPDREIPGAALNVPDTPVVSIAKIARANHVRVRRAGELLQQKGYLCAEGLGIRPEAVPEVRDEIRAALPDFSDVETALKRWDLPAALLPTLGFSVRWRG